MTNHKKVERLMHDNSIHGVFKAKKVRTTSAVEDNPPIPDLDGRRLDPGCPDAAWAGDITYIRGGDVAVPTVPEIMVAYAQTLTP